MAKTCISVSELFIVLMICLSEHNPYVSLSDASSEYLSAVEVTDSEDTGRNGSIIGFFLCLSPTKLVLQSKFKMIFVFCLQPSPMAPPEKQWGFPSSMEVMPQSQVVLLQPLLSNGTNCSPKAGSDSMRQSRSYTPILKSYPRIAPYPVDSPSKRVETSRLTANGTAGYEQRQRRRHDPQRPDISHSPLSDLQMQAQAVCNFEALSNKSHAAESQEEDSDKSLTAATETSSLANFTYEELRSVSDDGSMSAEKYQDPISMHSNKLKRFSNTYNILNKSGLLGITLRTKQLIKENKRTQGQLHLLQKQTALLLEALSSGDPQLLTKLQSSLQDTEKEQSDMEMFASFMVKFTPSSFSFFF
uniref:CLOCK-interacting pacemaker a n=1 Tax=Poecilia latipinna TaxID=48699 RepID=A0A3B3VAN0_9TELE